MVDETLRAKVIDLAKEKVRKMKPLAILESLVLIEYIEELEAVQPRVQRTNATEPPCAIARECYFGQDDKCLRGGVCR